VEEIEVPVEELTVTPVGPKYSSVKSVEQAILLIENSDFFQATPEEELPADSANA